MMRRWKSRAWHNGGCPQAAESSDHRIKFSAVGEPEGGREDSHAPSRLGFGISRTRLHEPGSTNPAHRPLKNFFTPCTVTARR